MVNHQTDIFGCGDEMTAKMALNSHIRQFQGVAFLFKTRVEKYL